MEMWSIVGVGGKALNSLCERGVRQLSGNQEAESLGYSGRGHETLRSHTQQAPRPPPPTGNKVFNCMACEGCFPVESYSVVLVPHNRPCCKNIKKKILVMNGSQMFSRALS